MKNSKIARKVGLAGLVALLNFSQESGADKEFSISGGLNGYSPLGDVVALDGIPYGVEFEGDYGDERSGFRAGASYFTKGGYKREEFGWNNRDIIEGESEISEIARFHGGARVGNPWMYFGAGGVVVEGRNLFEISDRRWFRRETSQFVDRRTLHGIYGEFSIGGRIEKRKNFGAFFKITYDKFFDRDNSGGVKFGAGVTLSP